MNPRKVFSVDVVLVWYFALMAGLTLWFRDTLPEFPKLLALYAACLALGTALPWIGRDWPDSKQLVLRASVCTVLVPVAFLSLAFLLPYVSPDDRSWQLWIWDRWLFGADASRAAMGWRIPVLTETLVIAYSSYYFLPLALGVALYRRGKWEAFEKTIFFVVFGFLLSYLCYFFFPARSPYLLFPERTLQGSAVVEFFQAFVVHAGIFKFEAFPSGHTALTIVTLSLAWRLHRPAFWMLLPLAVGIFLSTVVLGYHYAVDVLAGIVLASVILAVDGIRAAPSTCTAR